MHMPRNTTAKNAPLTDAEYDELWAGEQARRVACHGDTKACDPILRGAERRAAE